MNCLVIFLPVVATVMKRARCSVIFNCICTASFINFHLFSLSLAANPLHTFRGCFYPTPVTPSPSSSPCRLTTGVLRMMQQQQRSLFIYAAPVVLHRLAVDHPDEAHGPLVVCRPTVWEPWLNLRGCQSPFPCWKVFRFWRAVWSESCLKMRTTKEEDLQGLLKLLICTSHLGSRLSKHAAHLHVFHLYLNQSNFIQISVLKPFFLF